jgi:hypothetical protein
MYLMSPAWQALPHVALARWVSSNTVLRQTVRDVPRCCRALPEAFAPFLPQFLDVWVAHLWDNVQVCGRAG